MTEKDWSWYIDYGTYAENNENYRHMSLPKPQIQGVNLEASCREAVIELRRFPTGILVDEKECRLENRVGERICSRSCSMHPDKQNQNFWNTEVSMGAPVYPDKCSICDELLPCKHTRSSDYGR